MLKKWLRGACSLAGDSVIHWILKLVLVGCVGSLGLWFADGVQATARGQESPRLSAPTSQDPTSVIGTDDGAEEDMVRKPSSTDTDFSESSLSSLSNSSAPVAVVTVVISFMSFYLIALVVWMGLYYRTPAAVPPDLVREIQDLLDQAKYNEAYQRLASDSSFLARRSQAE